MNIVTRIRTSLGTISTSWHLRSPLMTTIKSANGSAYLVMFLFVGTTVTWGVNFGQLNVTAAYRRGDCHTHAMLNNLPLFAHISWS